jgi:hypothetical protein
MDGRMRSTDRDLRELEVGAALAARRRDELVAEGNHALAAVLAEVAAGLTARRDERRALALEVDAAFATVVPLEDTDTS